MKKIRHFQARYILLINRDGDDFVTTSYLVKTRFSLDSVNRDSDDKVSPELKEIIIFGLEARHLGDYEYLIVDYSTGYQVLYPLKTLDINSEDIDFFEIKSTNYEEDREMMTITAVQCEPIEILKYKRDSKIRKIIDS